MTTKAIPTAAREALFIALYQETFPAVARYIRSRGGSLEEAGEVFQESVVLYYEKLLEQPDVAAGHEAAYLMGIAKHRWLRFQENRNRHAALHNLPADAADEPTVQFSGTRLTQLLETVGQRCLQLLRAFYFEQQRPKDIATAFDFSGERSATVQKFKCLEKVRAVVHQNALRYDDFVD